MAQFQGKYQLVEHQNFYEFLVKSGVPEDAAKERSEDKPTLGISTDDKKIKLETKGKTTNNVSNLLLDGEVEENIGTYKMKTASKLNGNVLVVDSKTPDGLTLKKIIQIYRHWNRIGRHCTFRFIYNKVFVNIF
ncbi:hypothetical protein NQ318_021328 [Aromia moschata]|uniref:Uncharacterized protein n=1 Tax=Aromia moschata TaxID=1265417 RepID=A0AAV8ZCS2_9CUCU|nr:hypothetical protein NQ318_021328 [Aromia moschata]